MVLESRQKMTEFHAMITVLLFLWFFLSVASASYRTASPTWYSTLLLWHLNSSLFEVPWEQGLVGPDFRQFKKALRYHWRTAILSSERTDHAYTFCVSLFSRGRLAYEPNRYIRVKRVLCITMFRTMRLIFGLSHVHFITRVYLFPYFTFGLGTFLHSLGSFHRIQFPLWSKPRTGSAFEQGMYWGSVGLYNLRNTPNKLLQPAAIDGSSRLSRKPGSYTIPRIASLSYNHTSPADNESIIPTVFFGKAFPQYSYKTPPPFLAIVLTDHESDSELVTKWY